MKLLRAVIILGRKYGEPCRKTRSPPYNLYNLPSITYISIAFCKQ